MSKLFFTDKMCYPALTGITDIDLYLYIKTSGTLPSDLQTKGQFTQ